jgi:hypothetical protein
VEQRPLWTRHQLAQVIAGGIRLELPQDLGLAAAAGDLERRLRSVDASTEASSRSHDLPREVAFFENSLDARAELVDATIGLLTVRRRARGALRSRVGVAAQEC